MSRPTPWFLALALLTLGSCAVATTGGQSQRSMTAARASLQPEYRIFYDALADYGDWVLIEPFGYVFRPKTDFHDWRPYQYGFWAPTDPFGWVWISSEPYGWATYHYGRWFYDSFQGWVWQPGAQWGPAWVSWQMNDQYVGWAPLHPEGRWPDSNPPGGRYLFTAVDAMGSTDLGSRTLTGKQLGTAVASARPVQETTIVDGARVPVGPPFSWIERATGRPLARVRVENLLSGSARSEAAGDPIRPASGVSTDETRKAAEQAAREARILTERGGRSPLRLPIVKPPVGTPRAVPGEVRPSPATRDSIRRGSGG